MKFSNWLNSEENFPLREIKVFLSNLRESILKSYEVDLGFVDFKYPNNSDLYPRNLMKITKGNDYIPVVQKKKQEFEIHGIGYEEPNPIALKEKVLDICLPEVYPIISKLFEAELFLYLQDSKRLRLESTVDFLNIRNNSIRDLRKTSDNADNIIAIVKENVRKTGEQIFSLSDRLLKNEIDTAILDGSSIQIGGHYYL